MFANHLRLTVLAIPHLRIFYGFPYLLCATSKSPHLKRRNNRTHASCDGACSPWASRSIQYDSAIVVFNWKQKINVARECSLLGINFYILNTTTQHYAHTFPIYHSCARSILVEDITEWCSVKSLQHKLLWCFTCCQNSAFDICTSSNSHTFFETTRNFSNVQFCVIDGELPAKFCFKKRFPRVYKTYFRNFWYWKKFKVYIFVYC